METNTTNGALAPTTNQVARRDFSGMQVAKENQATAALVAKAQADITARWTMALHRPRNLDQVRTLILADCKRPGFARSAIYLKPIGDGITGLSIRFAEAAARSFGNIAMEVSQIYEDDKTRIIRVSATDLESNVTWPLELVVTKTVERKFLRKGQVSLGERENSNGERVHLVEASEDDLLNKQGALVSKALRTCILRIIPGNLQDEAYDQCNAILQDEAAKDPDSARNAMCDAFASMGVQPVDLEQYLAHELKVATPAEIEQLRRLYVAIRDGEATWASARDAHAEQLAAKGAAPKAEAAPTGKGTSAVKDALKKRQTPDAQPPLPGADPVTTAKATTQEEREAEPGWMREPGEPKK